MYPILQTLKLLVAWLMRRWLDKKQARQPFHPKHDLC